MGNIGILTTSGFSGKQAVLANVGMNLTAFIGVIIGHYAGEMNKVFT